MFWEIEKDRSFIGILIFQLYFFNTYIKDDIFNFYHHWMSTDVQDLPTN